MDLRGLAAISCRRNRDDGGDAVAHDRIAPAGVFQPRMWTRGVDTDLFRPDRAIELGFARPIFVSVGRVAVEKNLEAFLSLDLPGTKVVIGTGPEEAALKRRFPEAMFLGLLENGVLA